MLFLSRTMRRANRFLAHRQRLDKVFSDSIAGSRLVANRNHSLWRHSHFRVDDVFFPVAFGSRDVSGQAEILECGKRDVVSTSNAGFKHAAAPDRNLLAVADIMNLSCFRKSSDAADFDVNDTA